ncbi:hypothetical protein IW262DRAFT_1302245 [Armillaria fumosa]|nr:hypothetical protein IW262DRAFT_1302245 [Armillaria fumosa]
MQRRTCASSRKQRQKNLREVATDEFDMQKSDENYAAVSDRVRAWRNNIAVVPSHSQPIHPFDAHHGVFSFFNDEPYTPEASEDTSTLKALIHKCDRKFRYDDAKASERRNIVWRLVHHDPYTEPYDCEDFMHGKRDKRIQNHHASRDEPTNDIYNNTPSAGPSGLTTMMPSQPYPQPQSLQHLQAYTPAPPTSQSATLGLSAGYPRSFDGLALTAIYEQESRTRESDVKR